MGQLRLLGRVGLYPGTKHHKKFQPLNRQDMIGLHFMQNVERQIISACFFHADGCSESLDSEVGAGLLSRKIARRLADYVAQYGMRPDVIAPLLWDYCIWVIRSDIVTFPGGIDYLGLLDFEQRGGSELDVDSNPNLRAVYDYIQQVWICTLIGGYIGPEGVMVFQRGDGGFVLDNNEGHWLYYDEAAPYVAYALSPRKKYLEGVKLIEERQHIRAQHVPPRFESWFYPGVRRISLFTDWIFVNGQPHPQILRRISESWPVTASPARWQYLPADMRNPLRSLLGEWRDEFGITDDLSLTMMEIVEEE